MFGAGLIGFSFAHVLWLAIPCLMIAGFGFIVQMAASNTIIQTIVDDEKRGRVMSFYTMAFLGMAPVGSLLTGTLAARLGPGAALACNGVACVAGALLFATRLPQLRAQVRPIYVRLNILPALTDGIQAATTLSQVARE